VPPPVDRSHPARVVNLETDRCAIGSRMGPLEPLAVLNKQGTCTEENPLNTQYLTDNVHSTSPSQAKGVQMTAYARSIPTTQHSIHSLYGMCATWGTVVVFRAVDPTDFLILNPHPTETLVRTSKLPTSFSGHACFSMFLSNHVLKWSDTRWPPKHAHFIA